MKILLRPWKKSCLQRSVAIVADAAYNKNISVKKWHHTIAIARALPESFARALSSHHDENDETTTRGAGGVVSMVRARQQHALYVDALRRHVPVLCLPALEQHPDCAFVEDTVVAIGNRAVLTRPGHASRRGEVTSIRECLQEQLGMDVCDKMIRNDNNNDDSNTAFCDGGDVMYTGRHLFVGISNRTNEAAVDLFRDVFDGQTTIVAVPAVVQGRDVLHLKSAVTHIDERTLLVPQGRIGDELLQALPAAELGYTVVRLPNVLACNAVVVNGHVLAQDTNCAESRHLLVQTAQERNMGISFVDTSELAKKDAALTCCSVLLSL